MFINITEIQHFSQSIRKPTICTCENNGVDQLHSNCKADQCLCFRFTDSTIPLLSKSKIACLTVLVRLGLCPTCSEATWFSHEAAYFKTTIYARMQVPLMSDVLVL